MRRTRRHLAALLRHGPPTPEPELSPDQLAVRQALAALPHRYRQVLVLHYLLDLPVLAIAEQTATPEGTVKAQLVRGRRLMAEYFTEKGADRND